MEHSTMLLCTELDQQSKNYIELSTLKQNSLWVTINN